MSIHRTCVAPNGAQLVWHRVERVEFIADSAQAIASVKSWASEEAMLSKEPPAWLWTLGVQAAMLAVPDLIGSTERALVAAAGSPVIGGTVVEATLGELDIFKIRRWAEIKSTREAVIAGGLDFGGMRFDSGDDARVNIMGAAVDALAALQLGQPFSRVYTLADNSRVSLTDIPTMLSIGRALANHVEQQHAHAAELRAQINAATTPEQVAEVKWS